MSNGRNNKVLLGSGLLLAVTSSLCCIIPVLTIVGGMGGAVSAFSWATPLRPYLLVATILVLGFAFYRAYKPQRKDECGCEEKKNVLQSKTFLWVVAVLSVLLSTFPYYAVFFQKKIAPPLLPIVSIRHKRGTGIRGWVWAAGEGIGKIVCRQRKGWGVGIIALGRGRPIVK